MKASDPDKKKATLLMELYKEMGYSAMGVGPNDLAASLDFLKAEAKRQGLSLLSANLLEKGKLPFKPYAVFKLNGVRFGVTALTGPRLSEEAIEQGIEITEPVKAFEKILPKLKKKTDVIILLSNLGFREDVRLSQQFKEIDLIIGSGQGRVLLRPHKERDTYILRPNIKGKSIGSAHITVSGKKPIQLDNHNILLREIFPVDEKTEVKVSALGAT